jgi:hypothetical protein
MSKEKVVFAIDLFVDFAGKTREVIFAAVSKMNSIMAMGDDGFNEVILKSVSLGVSVQSPGDKEVNTVLGKTIAEGKARKPKSSVGTLFTTESGMINRAVVEALLGQEMEFFKQNPGKYIAGYNKDRELYMKTPALYAQKFEK